MISGKIAITEGPDDATEENKRADKRSKGLIFKRIFLSKLFLYFHF